MSSSTKNQTTSSKTTGNRAAVIRPINRRDGKQSYVRIDSSHQSVRQPSFRVQQLEDYVAQIRDHSDEPIPAPETIDRVRIPVPQSNASADIVNDISQQQRASSSALTSAEHLDALRVVSKIDAGYQWIADNNRNAALESLIIGDKVADLSEPDGLVQAPEAPTENPVSAKLVQDIATAIASVLTNSSEQALANKLTAETQIQAVEIPAPHHETFVEEPLQLEPEFLRPSYSLPVTEHSFYTREEISENQDVSDAAKGVSLTAAAWDVAAFRWPEVTDRILLNESMLMGLAQNCISMLSPYGKTIAVTSPDRNQGATTLAITLARLLASMGNKVLLVDADFSRPNLSAELGIAGVNWCTENGSPEPAGESIVHGNASGICVMAQGAIVQSSAPNGMPIYDVLERKLDQIRSEFDFIVLDAGPSGQIVDEMSPSSHLIDAAMLVNQDVHSPAFILARESLIESGVFKFIAAQNSVANSRAA